MNSVFKKILICLLVLIICGAPSVSSAQIINDLSGSTSETTTSSAELPNIYYRAKILKILDHGTEKLDGQDQDWQSLLLKILNGDERDKQVVINNGKDYVVGVFQKYSENETVVLAKSPNTPGSQKDLYYIVDRYRVPNLVLISVIFFALAIYFGRKRGLTSIVGMLFSVFIIFYYIIPHILKGGDPFWTCIVGAVVIILLSLYLSHGFNRRTTIALVSTLASLGLAIIIDLIFVYTAKLTGNGTEEAFYLQFDNFNINLQGLLLGGIIIGVLGVLDDVTTGQSTAVEEIFLANEKLTFQQLFKSGLSVGQEHIASLVNTLVLAYVGASFPLLLIYSSQKLQPFWITMNSNFIAEEMIRTLVGSSVLVIAVPLTTFLAAFWYSKKHTK